ncbi:MAG: hypothetical protein QMB37_09205 [Paludibacteraceae bacterium]
MKDKYEFILELLETGKLTPAQKERVMLLSTNVIKDSSQKENEIIKRIEEIEEKIKPVITTEPPDVKIIVHKHTPKEMVNFLHQFSKSDDLKWFTHNGCPLPFDYDSTISTAKKLIPKYPKISINYLTYSNVRRFLFEEINDKGKRYPCWDNIKIIQYTWFDVKDWCKSHPQEDPFNAEINNEPFLPYINIFKNVIEFRTDNKDLTFFKRIKQLISNKIVTDINPIYTDNFKANSKSLNIYIDTNLFFKALTQIIDWININKAKSNELEIDLVSNPQYYKLEIFHKKSYITSSIDNQKIKGIQGDFEKTRKNLFCVADWEILADFQYGNKKVSYNITCLDINTCINRKGSEQKISENVFSKLEKQIGGVKHILKLYKTI